MLKVEKAPIVIALLLIAHLIQPACNLTDGCGAKH